MDRTACTVPQTRLVSSHTIPSIRYMLPEKVSLNKLKRITQAVDTESLNAMRNTQHFEVLRLCLR